MPDFLAIQVLRDPETGETLGTLPADADAAPVLRAIRERRDRELAALRAANAVLERADTPEEAEAKAILGCPWMELQARSEQVVQHLERTVARAAHPNRMFYRESPYYQGPPRRF